MAALICFNSPHPHALPLSLQSLLTLPSTVQSGFNISDLIYFSTCCTNELHTLKVYMTQLEHAHAIFLYGIYILLHRL